MSTKVLLFTKHYTKHCYSTQIYVSGPHVAMFEGLRDVIRIVINVMYYLKLLSFFSYGYPQKEYFLLV